MHFIQITLWISYKWYFLKNLPAQEALNLTKRFSLIISQHLMFSSKIIIILAISLHGSARSVII